MTENAIFKGLYYSFAFPIHTVHSIMYKDHSDVYCFYIEGVLKRLLNGEVLIGYWWT